MTLLEDFYQSVSRIKQKKGKFNVPTIHLQIICQIHVESLLADTNGLPYKARIVTSTKGLGPGSCNITYIM